MRAFATSLYEDNMLLHPRLLLARRLLSSVRSNDRRLHAARRAAISRADYPTLTRFVRIDAPEVIATADLRHLNSSATRAMSSSLALPSTGGDLSCATQEPSGCCV